MILNASEWKTGAHDSRGRDHATSTVSERCGVLPAAGLTSIRTNHSLVMVPMVHRKIER